jgi:AcrR family transcriptional regulator
MPKKIPDVKKKILQSAERLFNSYSYEDVDMRLIAKEAGVSVGTVYYHFSDKSGIFMSACEKTVERLLVSMAGICNSRVHPQQRLNQYLKHLYQLTQYRKESIRKLFYEGILNIQLDNRYPQINTLVERIKNQLLGDVGSILKEMMPKDSPMEDKLIERLILSTLGTFFTLNERFPQEVEENIKYITRALETLLNIRGVSMEN